MRKLPSIPELRKISQPEAEIVHQRGAGRRITLFVRSISIYITRFFLYTPISANQVTILHAVIYFGGCSLLITAKPLLVLIGAVIARLAGFLDYVDGEVARYRGTEGAEGGFLDLLVDTITRAYLFVALTIGLYRVLPEVSVIVFGSLSMLALVISSATPIIQRVMMLDEIMERLGSKVSRGTVPPPNAKGILARFLRFYSPTRRLPRTFSFVFCHFNAVNFLVVAATVDLSLSLLFPALTLFRTLYVFLAVYAVLGSFDAIAKVAYVVGNRQIQLDSEAMLEEKQSDNA